MCWRGFASSRRRKSSEPVARWSICAASAGTDQLTGLTRWGCGGGFAAPALPLFRLVWAALPPIPGEKKVSWRAVGPPNLPSERRLRKSCQLRSQSDRLNWLPGVGRQELFEPAMDERPAGWRRFGHLAATG